MLKHLNVDGLSAIVAIFWLVLARRQKNMWHDDKKKKQSSLGTTTKKVDWAHVTFLNETFCLSVSSIYFERAVLVSAELKPAQAEADLEAEDNGTFWESAATSKQVKRMFLCGVEGCGEKKSGQFCGSHRALTAHFATAKHRVSFCVSLSNREIAVISFITSVCLLSTGQLSARIRRETYKSWGWRRCRTWTCNVENYSWNCSS